MRLEDILRCLEELSTRVARETLEAPSDRTTFGFGNAVGRYEGLRLAKEAIVAMHNDIEERRQRM